MTIELRAKSVIDDELQTLKQECQILSKKGITPHLKVILVGENPASLIYTKNKKKFCEKFGAKCDIVQLSSEIDPEIFTKEIEDIAQNPEVHGCFVQLPLPKQLQHLDVGQLIPPHKDVDGFHATNLYGLLRGDRGENFLLPCTPMGIIKLLKFYHIPIEGKSVVVIGRSLIVGKPMSLLMNNYNATVTLCHSHTPSIQSYTQKADIIVVAIGRPEFIGLDYINKNAGQIIIDVGINKKIDGSLCGDVNYKSVKPHVSAITPVPGGVGPMTILALAKNLVNATQRQTGN